PIHGVAQPQHCFFVSTQYAIHNNLISIVKEVPAPLAVYLRMSRPNDFQPRVKRPPHSACFNDLVNFIILHSIPIQYHPDKTAIWITLVNADCPFQRFGYCLALKNSRGNSMDFTWVVAPIKGPLVMLESMNHEVHEQSSLPCTRRSGKDRQRGIMPYRTIYIDRETINEIHSKGHAGWVIRKLHFCIEVYTVTQALVNGFIHQLKLCMDISHSLMIPL